MKIEDHIKKTVEEHVSARPPVGGAWERVQHRFRRQQRIRMSAAIAALAAVVAGIAVIVPRLGDQGRGTDFTVQPSEETSPRGHESLQMKFGTLVPERIVLHRTMDEASPIQMEAHRGDEALVIAEPITEQERTWVFIQVRSTETALLSEPGLLGPGDWKGPWGWVSTTDDMSELIEFKDPCPTGPVTFDALHSLWRPLGLVCFGGEELTVRAKTAPLTELGGFSNPNDSPTWLNAAFSGAAHALWSPEEEPPQGGGYLGQFMAWLDPARGLDWPEAGTLVDVTGHFDDPASASCRKYGGVEHQDEPSPWRFFDVMACRQHFVITGVTVLPS